jgi:hypothetical protein
MDRKRCRSTERREIVTEKVSPPAKMNKGSGSGSGSVSLADVMKEIIEIKNKMTKIEEDNLVFQKWAKDVDMIKGKLEKIDLAVDDFRRSEIEAKKACVLIKGIKFVGKGKFETRTETRDRLRALFADLDGFKSHMFDYYRMGGRKDAKDDGSKVPIRVIFVDVDQKFELFNLLRIHGKKPSIKNIQVLNDYPKFQVAEVKKLSQQGYDLRQRNQGLRTRIVPKGLSLVLQSRHSEDEKWTAVRES